MVLDVGSISLNANLAKYRESIKARRVRKNWNRSSELNGKNRYRKPPKVGLPDGALLLIR